MRRTTTLALLAALLVAFATIAFLTPAESARDYRKPWLGKSHALRVTDFCTRKPWHPKCQSPSPTPTDPTTTPTPTEPTPTDPTTSPTPTEPTPTETTPPPSGEVCTAPVWTTTIDDTENWQVDPYDPPNGIGYYGQVMVTSGWWNTGGYNFRQTLSACDYDSWYSVVTTDNSQNDGAVKAYPNTKVDYIDWGRGTMEPLTNYSSLGLRFAHQTGAGDGIWNWAWDVWLNGIGNGQGTTELMIWTENHNQRPAGSYLGNVTLGGHLWEFWSTSDNSLISFKAVDQGIRSGTLELFDFTNHLLSVGRLRTDTVLGQIGYGVELVSTNGQPVRFDVTDFWIHEVPR